MSSKMVPHVQTVLERGMEYGVLLQCHDSNIVAYRLCKYVAISAPQTNHEYIVNTEFAGSLLVGWTTVRASGL